MTPSSVCRAQLVALNLAKVSSAGAPFESFARKSLLRNMLHVKLMLVCCACKQELSGDLWQRTQTPREVKDLLLLGQRCAEQSASETYTSPAFVACFKYAGHATYSKYLSFLQVLKMLAQTELS